MSSRRINHPEESASSSSAPASVRHGRDNSAADTIVSIRNLSRVFNIKGGVGRIRNLYAVSSVSLDLRAGELVGLVGESGCGKTTLGRIVSGLEQATAGSVDVRPSAGDGGRRRGAVQAVFQDPSQSLNPRMRVGRSVAEPLRRPYREVRQQVEEALADVLLDPELATRYPHQLSGGQQQRVAIARAIISRPTLIVYDEAVSALDSVSQQGVTGAIRSITDRLGIAGLFISHDIHVVEDICDRIGVMYAGRLVEIRNAQRRAGSEFRHPYTSLLFRSIPIPDPDRELVRPKGLLAGVVPDPLVRHQECPFAARCPIVSSECRDAVPEFVGSPSGDGVACNHPGEYQL